ncbi:MAG: hypothetical protein ABJF04_06535 [Reichenbachiella sp.]|uniref:hypothetical protein n=1 Tax=Reichenbachiella sp. TaxID=2184521 RepID=UPI0032639B76
MSLDKIISKKIAANLTASVISADPSTDLEQQLWAINWFDLKRKWVYDLYNQLVFSHVKKIGATPIFKGQLKRSLIDSERLRRDMLLIVQYPKGIAFLNMISSKLFQLKGLLRASSVRHFQFGFMQRKSPVQDHQVAGTIYQGKLRYLVHVCEGSQAADFQSLIDFAASQDVFPHFVGNKSAMLGLQKSNSGLKTLDFMLNHVLVFSGFDDESLELFVQSGPYQEFLASKTNNYVGLFDRKI